MACNCDAANINTAAVAQEAQRRLREAHRLYGFGSAYNLAIVSEGLVKIVLEVVHEQAASPADGR